MTLVQQMSIRIPEFFLGLLIIVVSQLFAVGGLLLVRRFISHQRLKLHNDVAGFIYATLGVVYAVLLAFTVIVVWGDYDTAGENVDKEANVLSSLYRDAEAFPEETKQEVRRLLGDYVHLAAAAEWPLLSVSKSSPQVTEVINDLWAVFVNYSPQTKTEQIFFEQSLGKLTDLCELRRFRLFESTEGIGPMLWFVLIFGGMVTIVFTFFFGTENLKAQIIMTALLAVIIALILFMILEFEYPFSGDVSVSPYPIQQALKPLIR